MNNPVCIKVILRRVRATIVAVERQRVLHNSQFMSVALVIKRAMRVRPILLSSVACQAVPYFSHTIS